MRPSFLDDMSWAMAEVYGSVTDRLLVNLARHFPYIKNADQIRGSFDYQARLLAQMGQVNRESADIILQSLGGADAALRVSLEAAIMDALKGEEPKLRKAAQQGLLNGSGMFPAEVTPNQMQAFQAYYRQSADKLNLVNTVMLESTQAAYQATVADVTARISRSQSILNVGAGEVVAGVSAWNTAVREAVGKMVQNGLTGFVDHAGRQWSPEAYVAMDIRTTMFNTAREAISERAQEFGCDLYQVSSHNGARPLCYPWQGKVISRSGWTGTVKDLYGDDVTVHSEDEIESFRWGGGLFGVNCRHYPMNFIPGFSTLKGEPQDPEENEQAYAESQQQRALERKLRAERRDLAVLKAQGAPEDEIREQRAKVSKASSDIDAFCDETGRARRRSREYTPVDATWPDDKTYDPTTFPTATRDRIRDWYDNGGGDPPPSSMSLGPNNIPPRGQAQIPIQATQTPTEPAFTPAATIEEAESFAKTFTDPGRFGAVGISYKGVGLDVANVANETISQFYGQYNVDKFGGIVAPAGNTKMGKLVENAYAGYSPIRHSFILNRKSLKTLEIAEKHMAESRDLITKYLAHPENYEVKSVRAKKTLDASRKSGRDIVATNVREAIWHELGHSLEKGLRSVANYDRIRANHAEWGERISGYAASDFGEYIAESFCAMNKGEQIDPELLAGFEALKR